MSTIPKKKGFATRQPTAETTTTKPIPPNQPKPKMTPGQRAEMFRKLKADGVLQRQISDSDTVLRRMTTTVEDQTSLMTHLERCLHRFNGYTKYGDKNDDIYWYARNRKVHLSLHYGGSQTYDGAIHIKYITDEQKTLNFRIDVSETMLTPNPSVNENTFDGRYIRMSKLDIKRISLNIRDYQYCQEITNSICHCLDTYITQFMSTMGGKVKSRRRSQSYIRKTRKKKKTRRQK